MSPPIYVVSTAYNAAPYVARCVRSVRNQTLPCTHIYISDNSTDDTALQAANEMFLPGRAGEGYQSRLTVNGLDQQKGCIRNLVDTIWGLPKNAIVVWLDGDDWLWRSDALEYVLDAYTDGAWVTFGQFIHATGEPGWARAYKGTDFRAQGFYATHLKTFRAGLFQQIKIEDFLRPEWRPDSGEDGTYPASQEAWIRDAIDIAVMMPMLEMAGERHKFIPEVLMCYENKNPLSAGNCGRREIELAEAKRIMAMPRYSRLERAPW